LEEADTGRVSGKGSICECIYLVDFHGHGDS
jgi:hypothetical protein